MDAFQNQKLVLTQNRNSAICHFQFKDKIGHLIKFAGISQRFTPTATTQVVQGFLLPEVLSSVGSRFAISICALFFCWSVIWWILAFFRETTSVCGSDFWRKPWTLLLWLMACWNLSGLWRQGTNFCHWSQRHYRNEMNSLVKSGQESDGIASQSMKVELWSWKWTRCLEELLSPRIHWGPKHLCLLVRWLCLYNMVSALLFDPDVSRKMRDWLR